MSTPELFEHPLADELLAYQRMQDELEREHYGRWVIINGSDRVGEDDGSYQDAAAAAQELGLDVLVLQSHINLIGTFNFRYCLISLATEKLPVARSVGI